VAPALATSVRGDAKATLRAPHAEAAAAVRDVKAAPLFPALAAAAASIALLVDATDAAAVAAIGAKRAAVEAEAAAHGFCAAAAPGPHAPPFAPQPSATPLTEMEQRAAMMRRWRGGGWRRMEAASAGLVDAAAALARRQHCPQSRSLV
jgi:hypothetical protein